jgi:hypothetical protein
MSIKEWFFNIIIFKYFKYFLLINSYSLFKGNSYFLFFFSFYLLLLIRFWKNKFVLLAAVPHYFRKWGDPPPRCEEVYYCCRLPLCSVPLSLSSHIIDKLDVFAHKLTCTCNKLNNGDPWHFQYHLFCYNLLKLSKSKTRR